MLFRNDELRILLASVWRKYDVQLAILTNEFTRIANDVDANDVNANDVDADDADADDVIVPNDVALGSSISFSLLKPKHLIKPILIE